MVTSHKKPAIRPSSAPPKTERPPTLAGALKETTNILASLDQVQQSQTFRNGVRICTALLEVISNILQRPRP